MKSALLLALLLAARLCHADCPSTLPLKDVVTVPSCNPKVQNCVPANESLYQYMTARQDDDPHTLEIGLHGSPWHLYGPDYHILEIEEVAGMVRQHGAEIKRVHLLSSWSSVAPDSNGKSLAQKLSLALKGMPVSGEDGFVWFDHAGKTHTTQQAFTVRKGSGPYWIMKGEKVMASMVAGWPAQEEAFFAERQDGQGLMRAAAGFDIFMLCPERALQVFDAAAKLSDPIAAYNAALIRLERNAPGDKAAAAILLNQASQAGDKRAQEKLKALGASTQ